MNHDIISILAAIAPDASEISLEPDDTIFSDTLFIHVGQDRWYNAHANLVRCFGVIVDE